MSLYQTKSNVPETENYLISMPTTSTVYLVVYMYMYKTLYGGRVSEYTGVQGSTLLYCFSSYIVLTSKAFIVKN